MKFHCGNRSYLGEAVDLPHSFLGECQVLSIRTVLTEGENQHTGANLHKRRDEEGNSPGSEDGGLKVAVLEEGLQGRHDELDEATTHVTPPGSKAVSHPDNFGGEHGAHPVLHHKNEDRVYVRAADSNLLNCYEQRSRFPGITQLHNSKVGDICLT